MIILVATVAKLWYPCEFQLCYGDRFVLSAVTWTAGNGRVLSFKSELGSGMIERHELPAFDFMAEFTSARLQ